MSIHSIDGSTGLTKLERISVRAKRDTSSVFNNLGHAVDKTLLREQYRKLDGRKAIGIDGISKAEYGDHLDVNLEKLIRRIRNGTYKPKPSRLVEIPKEDGSTRPLAISCTEDKVVQSAVHAILTELYEPIFLSCSYGFRPNRNCHDALKAHMQQANKNQNGTVVEIDISKYFNTIPHAVLEEILAKKVIDKRFLNLLKALIKAPTLAGSNVVSNEIGCPQGSMLSPILANIYLHYVIDEWFSGTVQQHMQGRATMVRYADDMIFAFEHHSDAERFYKVLPKRFTKYGLTLNEKKSQVIRSGNYAAQRARQQGTRLPTYHFLGFTCYWGKARKGFWRLKYSSRKDRFTAKLKGLRDYLWDNRNADTKIVMKQVIRVVKGWINYHAITDNQRRVKAFTLVAKRIMFKWLNHRGGKRLTNWSKFTRMLEFAGYPEEWGFHSMF
jgi:RNA-directed DNA polymerase